MEVKRGWSTDYGKNRFDVEVGETDLLRILASHGCTDPEGTASRMDTWDVFRILDCEAAAYEAAALAAQEPGSADAHKKAAAFHRAERDRIVTRVLHPKNPAAGE